MHVYSDEERFVTAYTAELAISIEEARLEIAGGQTAFATAGGHIWIYLGNHEQVPEDARRTTLFHEYFHTLQAWQAQFETAGKADFIGGVGGEAYTVGWLRCERLATTRREEAVTPGFWLAMATPRDWRKAFAEASVAISATDH